MARRTSAERSYGGRYRCLQTQLKSKNACGPRADELRANSRLKSSEYSVPVFGLIFLRYADQRFTVAERELATQASARRQIGKIDYQARGVMYLPPSRRAMATCSICRKARTSAAH